MRRHAPLTCIEVLRSGIHCCCVCCVAVAGDDPQTYGQKNEVQTITCVAGATYSSSDYAVFDFRLNRSDLVYGTYPAMGFEYSVQYALEFMGTVRNVTVSIDPPATTFCQAGSTVNTRVTFMSGGCTASACVCGAYACVHVSLVFCLACAATEHGPLPMMGLVRKTNGIASVTITRTVTGDKESKECNNRGYCGTLTSPSCYHAFRWTPLMCCRVRAQTATLASACALSSMVAATAVGATVAWATVGSCTQCGSSRSPSPTRLLATAWSRTIRTCPLQLRQARACSCSALVLSHARGVSQLKRRLPQSPRRTTRI